MRNKKLLTKIAAVGGAVCLALTVLVSPVASVQVQAAAPGNEENVPYRDVYRWYYKVENGCLYRRLYNISVNDWEGDWQYVGRV